MTDNRYEPVPDNPAGANIPYRGVVDHGVPFTEVEPTDEAHYHTGRAVEWLPEEKEPEPIPVRIVREGSREVKTFHTSQITLTANERREIIGRDDRRTSLKVKNFGPDGAVVGDMNVSTYSGYLLNIGDEITLTTTEPLHAQGFGVATAVLCILVETVEQVK